MKPLFIPGAICTNVIMGMKLLIFHLRVKKVQFSLSTMPWWHLGGAEVLLHSFLTSALDGDEWLTSHPDCFTPRKEPQYPLKRRMWGPQRWCVWFWEEISLLLQPDSNPDTCSSQLNHYTNWAILAPHQIPQHDQNLLTWCVQYSRKTVQSIQFLWCS
jgi:hypothetical protein